MSLIELLNCRFLIKLIKLLAIATAVFMLTDYDLEIQQQHPFPESVYKLFLLIFRVPCPIGIICLVENSLNEKCWQWSQWIIQSNTDIDGVDLKNVHDK